MADYPTERCRTCGTTIRPAARSRVGSWCCRVWLYVDWTPGTGACWPWTGAKNRNGYGFLSKPGHRSSNMLGHRAAYELTKGSIEAGLVLMHRCDVPACCNPDHLTPATQAENIQDARQKGRMTAPPGKPGEANPNAQMTDEKVRAIRLLGAEGLRQGVIGKQLGVSRGVVNSVLCGRSWRHVQ